MGIGGNVGSDEGGERDHMKLSTGASIVKLKVQTKIS